MEFAAWQESSLQGASLFVPCKDQKDNTNIGRYAKEPH